jgi:hypothetical protein
VILSPLMHKTYSQLHIVLGLIELEQGLGFMTRSTPACLAKFSSGRDWPYLVSTGYALP